MSDQKTVGPDDEFDEPFDELRPGTSMRTKLVVAAASVVGLIALAFVGWFAFQQGIQSGTEETTPVIPAPLEPIKRRPDDPGGLDVPHQDKLVFNRMAPGQINEPVERLLPRPEEPAERPIVPRVPAEIPAANQVLPERRGPPPRSNMDAEAPSTAQRASPPPKPLIAKPPPLPPSPTIGENKPVAPPTSKLGATSAGGGWKVQLASVSSNAAAEREWKRMQLRNSDLLGNLSLTTQTIKLDRGTFYRIQAGPLADLATANNLCGSLKARKQDCLIVAP
jgi:cell division septation protein DedD